MLIGVVKLSDIHFRESGNWIQENANSVIDAVRANDQCDAYVVVVSGNVAYSGHANEYLQAAKYLDVIRSGLTNLCPSPVVGPPAVQKIPYFEFAQDSVRSHGTAQRVTVQRINCRNQAAVPLLAAQRRFFDNAPV